jgi:hypothetical protein
MQGDLEPWGAFHDDQRHNRRRRNHIRCAVCHSSRQDGRERQRQGQQSDNQHASAAILDHFSVHIEPQTGVMAELVPAIHVFNSKRQGTPFSANWDTWGFDDPHTQCEDLAPPQQGFL